LFYFIVRSVRKEDGFISSSAASASDVLVFILASASSAPSARLNGIYFNVRTVRKDGRIYFNVRIVRKCIAQYVWLREEY
jgi:hypothetical protein